MGLYISRWEPDEYDDEWIHSWLNKLCETQTRHRLELLTEINRLEAKIDALIESQKK